MHDLGRERIQAWAKLLEEPAVAGPVDPARTVTAARSECQLARVTIGAALGALAERPRPGLSREWVACIDEILAIADRACAMLVAAQSAPAEPSTALWPVWQGGPAS